MMDEVVAFVEAFLDAEWALRRCYCTERDDEAYQALKNTTWRTFAHGTQVAVGTVRSSNNSASFFKGNEAALEKESRRSLFQIKKYLHETHGELYRAYVGKLRVGYRTSYAENLYVRSYDGELKLFAQSRMCPDCTSLGELEGSRCRYCGGEGWLWTYSDRIELDKPVEICKIEPPARKKCLQEYEAE